MFASCLGLDLLGLSGYLVDCPSWENSICCISIGIYWAVLEGTGWWMGGRGTIWNRESYSFLTLLTYVVCQQWCFCRLPCTSLISVARISIFLCGGAIWLIYNTRFLKDVLVSIRCFVVHSWILNASFSASYRALIVLMMFCLKISSFSSTSWLAMVAARRSDVDSNFSLRALISSSNCASSISFSSWLLTI